jgi:prepilin-type N-terminal cleavage/methylation domain-containing protein/prepilin-type processing-associated H-X9-DG protein
MRLSRTRRQDVASMRPVHSARPPRQQAQIIDPQSSIINPKGFTLIELLVVIAIIAVLMAILMPAMNRAKEQGKRATCLSNLKNLALSWIMYADENDDKIVCGDSGEYTFMNSASLPFNRSHYRETPWVLKDYDTTLTEAQRETKITDGALFPYARSLKLYKCPTVERKVMDSYRAASPPVRTYSIADSMNCRYWDEMHVTMLKKRGTIKEPAFRVVFLDDGGTCPSAMGGWTVYANQWKWWDPPPVRHGDGTNFSFADGHMEYHKWEDDQTIEFGRRIPPTAQSNVQTGNMDIKWAAFAVWGHEAQL